MRHALGGLLFTMALALPLAADAQQDGMQGGRTLVHGVLVAQWQPDPQRPNSAEARVASVVLLPGAESAAQISGRLGRALASIDMVEGMQALRLAAGATVAGSFARRGVTTVQVEGVFALDQLVPDAGCPRGARARLVEADPINVQTGRAPAPLPCRRD